MVVGLALVAGALEVGMGVVVRVGRVLVRMARIVVIVGCRVPVLVGMRMGVAVRVRMAVDEIPMPVQVLVDMLVRVGVFVGVCGGLFRHGILPVFVGLRAARILPTLSHGA